MLIDAAVLAGGRSTRLGSVAKATLHVRGRSLLEHALSAASSVARTCVVVGPVEPGLVSSAVFVTREDPPFSGPAAAVAAGVHHLSTNGTSASDAILVLACDMPGIAAQVPALVDALTTAPSDVDGVISVDATGHRQPLACLYRRRALISALSRFDADSLDGLSMRKLIEPLNLMSLVAVPGATDDVDTWEDAARLGATDPTAETEEAAQ
ncbi:molybdenum cofactor guanylyltransferase [Salinibacterium sp. SWN167]|uniref:molybdenum cofactor guanylyltransferase n=1 Tax=Salinibacterium sp. SWN167 TaxID=2792054 RepID=UPI0018CF12FB|nr:NTP transferase domain-containing protein [Salinibacterium sp. SWN167]MBH0082461.1 NTP transferase domain-containing protein [Salinibacterium sp. SWN167]